jgi:predicted aspartyl protease
MGALACGSQPRSPTATTPNAPAQATQTASSAPPSSEARDQAESVPPDPSQRRHAALHFRQIEGKAFPYALLRASVRGQPTWLMLDTGASHHVLGSWLARKLGIAERALPMEGRGHSGERVAVRGAHNPELVVEAWGAVGGDRVLVADLPAVFEKLDLGGVASPQALAEDGGLAVLVDFPARRLELTAESNALASLVGTGYWLARCKECVCGSSEGRAPGYVIEARVGGHAVRLAVDSGAETTDLRLTSSAGKTLRSRAKPGHKTETAGGRYTEQIVSAVAVTVGDVSRQLDVALVPGSADATCPADGNLGMDMLSSCVLVLTRRSFAARCQ